MRTMMLMVRVPIDTIIEDPCSSRAAEGPSMATWAFYDEGKVEVLFLHPIGHPKLEDRVPTQFEIPKGGMPDVALMLQQLGFTVEKKQLVAFLSRVAVVFGLSESWAASLLSSTSSYPPPHRDSSQPPALVN